MSNDVFLIKYYLKATDIKTMDVKPIDIKTLGVKTIGIEAIDIKTDRKGYLPTPFP